MPRTRVWSAVLLWGLVTVAIPACENRDDTGPANAGQDGKAAARAGLSKIGRAVVRLSQSQEVGYYDRKSQKLGLSWRVAMLPALGYGDLYKQFKLSESWDSPHNKALLEQMPDEFRSPRGEAPKGHTFYRGVVGERAMIPPPFPTDKVRAMRPLGGDRLVHTGRGVVLPDGSVNTLFVVEAADPVPWTKPDEVALDPDPAKPLPKLGGVFEDGFFGVSAAGAVVFVPRTTDPATVRALLTYNGGEPIADKGVSDQLDAPPPADPNRATDPTNK